ncbi:cip1-interacting zinc finger protein-like protein, partial [Lates japonicus]
MQKLKSLMFSPEPLADPDSPTEINEKLQFLRWPRFLLPAGRGRQSGSDSNSQSSLCLHVAELALASAERTILKRVSVLVNRGQRSTGPGSTMVKQQRRTDRCFIPAAGNTVAQVRFPVGPIQRRQPPPHQVSGRKWAGSGTGSADSRQHCGSSTTTEEERGGEGGDPGPDGGSGETKRARLDRAEEAAAQVSGSRDQPAAESSCAGDGVSSRVPPPDQQGSAELSEDSRAAELQSVGSLKVTIQQSSESREFGQTDRTADRQTGGLHCHVCNLTCRSLQVFHEHMSG